MKWFINIFGMSAAGVLGYMAEPSLRVQLTGIQPTPVEMAENGKLLLEIDRGKPAVDLASLAPEQLPKKIKLHTEVKVSDTGSGITMTIQAGNRVNLVRIEEANAIISPGEGPFIGKVPVMDTDLLEQLTTVPPANPPPAVTPEPATPPAEPLVPTTGESEEPEKTPEQPPTPEPAPEPEPQPEPTPAPPPIPEAAPMDPAIAGEVPGAAEIVQAMQASVQAADVKEFTLEQVTEWKATAVETIDGESFQTGLATYHAETIFGKKPIQAKALVKGGKVIRWIWPKSGMEIK